MFLFFAKTLYQNKLKNGKLLFLHQVVNSYKRSNTRLVGHDSVYVHANINS